MSVFQFTEERRTAGRLSYDAIASYRIPALDFPDDGTAAEWEAALDYFESEFYRWGDMDRVIVDGREMYGFEHRFFLADWIYETALDLGATVGGSQPGTNNPQPYVSTMPAPASPPTAGPQAGQLQQEERKLAAAQERLKQSQKELRNIFKDLE